MTEAGTDYPTQEESHHICSCQLDVESIMSSNNMSIRERLAGCDATIFVHLEPSNISNFNPEIDPSKLHLHLRGMKFQNIRRSFVDRPDFYYEIQRLYKGRSGHTWDMVFRSERVKGSTNPLWEPATLDLERLCNYETEERDLRISVWDYDHRMGMRTFLGSVETTVDALIRAEAETGNSDMSKALLISSSSQSRRRKSLPSVGAATTIKGYLVVVQADYLRVDEHRASGALSLETAAADMTPQEAEVLSRYYSEAGAPPSESEEPVAFAVPMAQPDLSNLQISSKLTFDDYTGMTELELCVGIEFNTKNGDYNLPNSGHFLHPGHSGQMNDYEWVISVIGRIVGHYNKAKQYPVYGFGAEFQGRSRPIFQCGPTPKAHDVKGIVDAYRHIFKAKPILGKGPSNYNHVIQQAASHATNSLNAAQGNGGRLSYTVLLILTTGNEEDIKAAVAKLEEVSVAPLSAIFIKMDSGTPWRSEKLDFILSKNGARQFCTFTGCDQFIQGSATGSGRLRNSQSLGRVSFDMVTSQMVSYFSSRGMYPPR
eukprot:CAMPEP_0118682014 /NCGR_PEP_ID=MMETSP0800-20121206/5257_1 /TAXON_ID=210618 ORGANISM="Striatella unipunctata, Strain CCMP2910" /NCGR_SAMPLE_ID=MMETSP0800 /ASSEMBLY_ACC=CAM_ASM_000638 /LENGTH=541 /DNA_ID=CAMNT_0006578371 /DNA_START=301 /DNA_END=1926 /DNA_ORIENTATION=+